MQLSGTGEANLDFALRDGTEDSIGYRDCVASVDIVDWDAALEGARFGLLLRVKPEKAVRYVKDAVPPQRYSGLLTFKRAGNPAESELALLGSGGWPIEVKRIPAVDPAKQYSLQLSPVGQQLTLQLFDLANLGVPVETCTGEDDAVTEGMVAMQGTVSADGKFDVTIDRFIGNGSTR